MDENEGGRPETAAPASPDAFTRITVVDRVVRPLRRVLARGVDRAATDPWFARSVARLAEPLGTVALPPPLDETLRELAAGVRDAGRVGGDDAVEHLHAAARALRRLDEVLGLPLTQAEVTLRRRLRRLRVPVEVEAVQDSAPAAPRAPTPPRERSRPASVEVEPAPAPAVKLATDEAAAPPTEAREPSPRRAPASPLAGARWETSLEDLPLAEEVVDACRDVGLESVWDVLTLAPTGVEMVAPVFGAGCELPEGRVAVGGRVRARATRLGPGGSRRSDLVLVGADRLPVAWHRPFTAADLAALAEGSKVVLLGTRAGGEAAGDVHLVDAVACRGEHGAAVRVTYGVGDGEGAVDDVVRVLLPDVVRLDDPLPQRLRDGRRLLDLPTAVQRVHARGGDPEAERRLAYDEALSVQLGLSALRLDGGRERGVTHTLSHGPVATLQTRDGLPPLPEAAQAALDRLKRDLRSSVPMLRVVAGPPTSGVDDVALHAILSIAEGKSQVLVVSAELPLVTVALDRWEETLRAAGLQPQLLAGEVRASEHDALRRGEIQVAFATLATLDAGLDFRRLGLVIALEQRSYGEVVGRAATLRNPRPDVLGVARTAVPASLLLSAWPTADASFLGEEVAELPAASGQVWPESEREQAYLWLAEQVAAGRPAIIVFPLRRPGVDLLSLRDVDALVTTLRTQFFKSARVGLFHGAQGPRERQAAWRDFVERRTQVLVATFPVEGLGVFPRATAALVEYADRLDPQRLLGIRTVITPAGTAAWVRSGEPDVAGSAFVRDLADGLPDAEVVRRHPEAFLVPDEVRAARAADLGTRADWRWLVPTRDRATLLDAREDARAVLAGEPLVRGQPGGPRQPQAVRLLRYTQAVWSRLLPDDALPVPVGSVAPGPAASGPVAAAGNGAAAARKRRRKKKRRT